MTRRSCRCLRGSRVGGGPLDDLLRLADRLAVVGHEDRHPALAGQPLRLLATFGLVQHVRQQTEPVRADHLGLPAGFDERVVRVLAWMPARSRARERSPADVELHGCDFYTVRT